MTCLAKKFSDLDYDIANRGKHDFDTLEGIETNARTLDPNVQVIARDGDDYIAFTFSDGSMWDTFKGYEG